MARGKSRADLDTDRKLNLSLVRLLEIVGEAAGRVPKPEQDRYPAIPWTEIISLRNRLIHGYDQVDFDILWTILTEDLPPLIGALGATLPAVEGEPHLKPAKILAGELSSSNECAQRMAPALHAPISPASPDPPRGHPVSRAFAGPRFARVRREF